MLAIAMEKLRGQGYKIANLDCIIFAERPKLKAYKPEISRRIAEILQIAPQDGGVKAKTGEAVGPVGHGQAIMAQCVALLDVL